jgi:hypothetical protein
MVSHRVGGLLAFGWLVELALLLAELGRSPHLQRTLGKPFASGSDGVYIPFLQLPKALVEAQGAGAEAALLVVALLKKGTVAEFWVVAGESEVAETMQLFLLDLFPVGPQGLLPGLRQLGFWGRMCSIV